MGSSAYKGRTAGGATASRDNPQVTQGGRLGRGVDARQRRSSRLAMMVPVGGAPLSFPALNSLPVNPGRAPLASLLSLDCRHSALTFPSHLQDQPILQLATEVQSSLTAFWTADRLTGLTAALVEHLMLTVGAVRVALHATPRPLMADEGSPRLLSPPSLPCLRRVLRPLRLPPSLPSPKT